MYRLARRREDDAARRGRPGRSQPAIYYAEPTAAEVQEIVRLAGFTGRMAADYLGLADKSGRQIRRWCSGGTGIPYSAWALLCYAAGFGHIWEIDKPPEPRDTQSIASD